MQAGWQPRISQGLVHRRDLQRAQNVFTTKYGTPTSNASCAMCALRACACHDFSRGGRGAVPQRLVVRHAAGPRRDALRQGRRLTRGWRVREHGETGGVAGAQAQGACSATRTPFRIAARGERSCSSSRSSRAWVDLGDSRVAGGKSQERRLIGRGRPPQMRRALLPSTAGRFSRIYF